MNTVPKMKCMGSTHWVVCRRRYGDFIFLRPVGFYNYRFFCLGHLTLSYLLTKIKNIDPDIIVGHDLLDFGFEFLLQRAKINKISQWSRLARFRLSKMLKFTMRDIGMDQFSLGAGYYTSHGRLVVDVKNSAKELGTNLDSYDLCFLSDKYISDEKYRYKKELNLERLVSSFESHNALQKLLSEIELDAYRCVMVANMLQSIPIAIEITKICGYKLSKILQGSHILQRTTSLLLYAFHEKGQYILPENGKREDTTMGVGLKGGLVFEPKSGLYKDYVLLLDFNSMYPSVIQEYNFCISTVQFSSTRSANNNLEWLPEVGDNMAEGRVLRV